MSFAKVSRRHKVVIALLLLSLLAAPGCLFSRSGGTLTIGVQFLPPSLDPSKAQEASLLSMVYETLVARGPDGDYYPGLATSWTVTPDGRTITLAIRPGVKFSDGTALTADAAVASLKHLLDSDKTALGPTEKIEASGSNVVLTLSRPYPPIWDALANPRAAIALMPASGAPIGTGPFIVSGSTADSLTLNRNQSYRWAPAYYRTRGPARLSGVTVKRYSSAEQLTGAVNSGEVDLAGGQIGAPPSGWSRLTAPGQTLTFLGLNTRTAPLADARVRLALALLLAPARTDAGKAIVGWSPTTAFLPRGVFGATEAPAPSGDPAALLSGAGFTRGADGGWAKDGQPLALTIACAATPDDQVIANALSAALKAGGIGATVSATSDYLTRVASGGFQLFVGRYTWSDPDILYYLFHTGGEANRTGYSSPAADRLLEAASAAVDISERRALYQAIQGQLSADCPVVPLLTSDEVWMVRDGVRNVRAGTGGVIYLLTGEGRR